MGDSEGINAFGVWGEAPYHPQLADPGLDGEAISSPSPGVPALDGRRKRRAGEGACVHACARVCMHA